MNSKINKKIRKPGFFYFYLPKKLLLSQSIQSSQKVKKLSKAQRLTN